MSDELERGMQNFVHASGIWGRAGGGDFWTAPGLACATTTVARRAFNQIIITSADVSDDDLRAAIQRFDDEGLRYRVRLLDCLWDSVGPRLERMGLEGRGGIPAMAFTGDLPELRPCDLVIEPVTNERRLAEMTAVVAEAFGWETEELAEVFRAAIIGEPGWYGWVGCAGGDPVAASQIVVHEGTVGIYYVAVLSTRRRKGYGEAITRAAVEAGFERGCDLSTLNASPDGLPVYKRMGFREIGRHLGYVPPDPDDPTH